MAIPVEKMSLEEIRAENKALMKKKAEIHARQALLAAAAERLHRVARAEGRLMGLGYDDLEALGDAAARARAKIARENAKQ